MCNASLTQYYLEIQNFGLDALLSSYGVVAVDKQRGSGHLILHMICLCIERWFYFIVM